MGDSIPEYIRFLGKGWYLVIFSLASGALGFVQDLVNSGILPPVFGARGLPPFLWYAASMVALGVAPFWAFHRVRVERDQALEEVEDTRRLGLATLDYDQTLQDKAWPMYAVAFMWHGIEPPAAKNFEDLAPAEVEHTHTQLSQAVVSGRLKVYDTQRRGRRSVNILRAEHIVAYCEDEGLDPPKFLRIRG